MAKSKRSNLKAIAGTLLLTFGVQNLAPAAELNLTRTREQQFENQLAIAELASGRPSSLPSTTTSLNSFEQSALNAVSQETALQDLEAQNRFTLTTANDDLIEYVGNTIRKITTKDGVTLTGIALDSDGRIKDARLNFTDGSTEVLSDGRSLSWTAPDGRVYQYDASGRVARITLADGSVIAFTHELGPDGSLVRSIAESSSNRSVYDAQGRLLESLDKTTQKRTLYENGLLKEIQHQGLTYLYEAAPQDGKTVVALKNIRDAQNNTFEITNDTVTRITTPQGTRIENILWSGGRIANALIRTAQNEEFVYETGRLIRHRSDSGVETTFTYTPDRILTTSSGETTEYDLTRTALKKTSSLGITTYHTQGTLKGYAKDFTASNGTLTLYEYTTDASGNPISVKSREVLSGWVNTTSFVTSAAINYTANPTLAFDFTFLSSGAKSFVVKAENTSAANVILTLTPGSGSNYKFGTAAAVTLPVALDPAKSYTGEVRWETAGIGIYIYEKGLSRPATPLARITNKTWNPKFTAIATDTAVTRFTPSSGTITKTQNLKENTPSFLKVPAAAEGTVRFDTSSTTNKIIWTAVFDKDTAANTQTTLTYTWASGKWTISRAIKNLATGGVTTTNTTVNQALSALKDYKFEFSVEGTQGKLWVYDATTAKPATATVTQTIPQSKVSFNSSYTNATASSKVYQDIKSLSPTILRAAPFVDDSNAKALLQMTQPSPNQEILALKSLEYTNGLLTRFNHKDGSSILFEGGVAKEAINPDGRKTALAAAWSEWGNLTQTSIDQGEAKSFYDAKGNLTQIAIGDLKIFYHPDTHAIDYIQTPDTTEIHDPVFVDGELVTADVYDTEGNKRVYEEGRLKRLVRPDKEEFALSDDGRLISWVTNESLRYTFDYSDPGLIRAVLDRAPDLAILPTTPREHIFDTNLNLQRVLRENASVIDYLEDGTALLTDEALKTRFDAQGNAVSSQITDAHGRVLDVTYRYGKIREIKEGEAILLEYSYSFDAAGKEETRVRDLKEGVVKLYLEGKLLNSTHESTRVVSLYEYDSSNRVSRVTTERLGRKLSTHTYRYEGDKTLVTDDSNILRVYDTGKKLIQLTRDGKTYGYTHEWIDADHEGPGAPQLITTEVLEEQTLNDGAKVIYSTALETIGDILRIEHSDGRMTTGVTLDAHRNIASSALEGDGVKTLYRGAEVIGLRFDDGREYDYKDGALTRFKDPILGEWSVRANTFGQKVLKRGDLELFYNDSGALIQAKALNIPDADTIREETSHNYEGGYAGRLGIDGDFETAHRDQRRHYSGGVGSITSGFTFPQPQNLESLTYKMASFGEAHGNYIKDYSAWVVVEAQVNGVWTRIPGTYEGQDRVTGDGSLTVNTGVKTLNDLNLNNVTAIRAMAHGYGNSSDNGNANGGADIYEFGYTVTDRSIFNVSMTGDALKLTGKLDSLTLSSNGTVLSSTNSDLTEAVSALNQIAGRMASLPSPSRFTITPPAGLERLAAEAAQSVLSSETLIRQEYSANGVMEVQVKADKTATVFEDNHPVRVLSHTGEELIRYGYAEEGTLESVKLLQARKNLPNNIRAARSQVYAERVKTLKTLAESKNLATDQIARDSDELRAQINSHLDYWKYQREQIQKQDAKGKEARSAKAKAMDSLDGAVEDLQGRLDDINQQEADAYARLHEDVKRAGDQIDQDTRDAFTQLYIQKKALEDAITREEISPVIYDLYRRTLGRDPSRAEYDYWLERTDFATGEVYFDEKVALTDLEPAPGSARIESASSSLTVPDSDAWDFGLSDFTVDFWASFDSNSTAQNLFEAGEANGFSVAYDPTAGLTLRIASDTFSSPFTPETQTFTHLAVTRSNGVIRLFANGKMLLQYPPDSATLSTGEIADFVFNPDGALNEIRLTANNTTSFYTPQGYLKREAMGQGQTRYYSYDLNPDGSLRGVRVTTRAMKSLGGIDPPVNPLPGVPLRLAAYSAGMNDGWTAGLYADDRGVGSSNYNYFATGERWRNRGIDIAILDEGGKLVKSDIFDTYLSTAESDRLALFLEDVAPGHYALMGVTDEASRYLTDRAKFAIESFGSEKIRSLSLRDSWAMIGRKGLQKGQALEELKKIGEGPARISNFTTTVTYSDAQGNPISGDAFENRPNLSYSSTRAYHSSENLTGLTSFSNGLASGFKKVFNDNSSQGGFYSIFDDPGSDYSKLLGSEFDTAMFTLSERYSSKAIYFDERYAVKTMTPAQAKAMSERYRARGFEVLNAEELATFVQEKGEGAFILMPSGVAPATVYDRDQVLYKNTTDLIRPYLEKGGALIWAGEPAFFNVGSSDGALKVIGEIGAKEVLGVTPVYTRRGESYQDFVVDHAFNTTDTLFTGSTNGSLSFNSGAMVLAKNPASAGTFSVTDNRSTHYMDLPEYAVTFKPQDISIGTQAGLKGDGWGGGNTFLYFTKTDSNHLTLSYNAGYSTETPANVLIDPAKTYVAEYKVRARDILVFFYEEGTPRPETPLFYKKDQTWNSATFAMNVPTGASRIERVAYKAHKSVYFPGERVTQKPMSFSATTPKLDLNSLKRSDLLKTHNLKNLTGGVKIGAQGFKGYMEEFRVSSEALYKKDFTPDSQRAKATDSTLLLMRPDKGSQSNFIDVSKHARVITEGTTSKVSNLTFKFEKSSPSGLKKRSEVTQARPALMFDGKGRIKVAHRVDLSLTEPRYTVDFWMNPKSIGSRAALVSQSFGDKRIALMLLEDGRLSFTHTEGIATLLDLTSSAKVSPDTWQHIALTKENGVVKLYIDGKLVAQATYALTPQEIQGDFTIGGDDTFGFIGHMDEFRVSGVNRFPNPFTPVKSEITDLWGTDLLIRESFTSEKVFSDATGKIILLFTEGVYPDEETSPFPIHPTKPLNQVIPQSLLSSGELLQRREYVTSVKARVTSSLNTFKTRLNPQTNLLTPEAKTTLAQEFGLESSSIIDLSKDDIDQIIRYIESRSLHFGQSAFLSLESLLDQKGIPYAREDIAVKAILIDVLSGILTPLDEGDLILSIYSLQKVGESYGLETTALKLTWNDLVSIYQANPNARLIAHIGGIHFVTITGIDEAQGLITYIDMGSGRDKENETVLTTKDTWSKTWEGYVLTPVENTSAVENIQSKVVSTETTKQIRGSFFAFLIPFIISALASVGSVIGSLLATIGTLAVGIGSLIGTAITAIGQAILSIGSLIGSLGQALFQGIHFGLSSLFGASFASGATAGGLTGGIGGILAGQFTTATLIQSALTTGLNFAITAGLDAIGLDPQITRYVGSFVSGGVLGGLSSFGSFVSNGFLSIAPALGQDLGLMLNIDPTLRTSIGILAGGFTNGLTQITTAQGLTQTFTQSLTQAAAFYGINKISSSLGLDPRLTQLVGMPIMGALNAGLTQGQNASRPILQSLQDGLLRSAIAYGVDFAARSITDSTVLRSLSTRVISGAIEGALLQKDALRGIFDAVKQSVVGILGASSRETIANAISFTALMAQEGAQNAIQMHLTQIFNRQSVESIWRSGGVASAIISPKEEVRLPDGRIIYRTTTSSGEGLLFDSSNTLIGFQRNGLYQTGEFGITSNGSFGLIRGKSMGTLPTGASFEATIQDGVVRETTTLLTDRSKVTLRQGVEGKEIRFDVDGNMTEGEMVFDDEIKLRFANATLDGVDFLYQAAATLKDFAVGTGQALTELLNDVFLMQPQTHLIESGVLGIADMKLDWIGNLNSMLKDTVITRTGFIAIANHRWGRAVTDAVPHIVDLIKNTANKFIFTPGVNSGVKTSENPLGHTIEEINTLAGAFDLTGDKRLLFAHSAGTEAQLKAILKAKQEGVDLSQFKFVFASPRVRRVTFEKYLNDAGIRPDQVLVVTAAGDYPHWPTDIMDFESLLQSPADHALDAAAASFMDYQNNRDERGGLKYSYVYLVDDTTLNQRKMLQHGGMVDGAMADHTYRVLVNGTERSQVRLRSLYKGFNDGNL